LPGFSSKAFLPLRVEIHLAQTELNRFGNGKCIEMKNMIAEGRMGLIYCNYMEFKASKNLLVFKIKM